HLATRSGIPDPKAVERPRTHHPPAVGEERHARDPKTPFRILPAQAQHLAGSREVPKADRPVFRTADDPGAVGGEGHAVDRALVATKPVYRFAGRRVPDPHGLIR